MSRHRSDVVGCAQPSERSARRSAQPIPSVLASDATPRCASMASADRQRIGDATPEPQPALQVMRLEYWDFLTAATLADVFPDGFPGFALEHAAVIETSLMLHYHPSLVRTDLIPDEPPADFPPYDLYPTPKDWVPPSGVLSSAKGASAEKGQRMAHELAQRMAAAVARALR
ncbi:creatininase family protein [Verminephrobacter eiseniae]|uniref:creatininase family protein n=1 Tax=Verminephrobacter eiseniae TaxID=364317 RepID=UPI00223752A3|nr:creatininase family protein [Verminephrobacter eiseniae]